MRHAASIAFFAAIGMAMFWRLWAPDRAARLVLGGPQGDFARQFHPYRAFVAEAWASLRPPLWNPHQLAGTPAWEDPQMAVVYPWRALDALVAVVAQPLPIEWVAVEAVAHLVIAATLAAWLAHTLVNDSHWPDGDGVEHRMPHPGPFSEWAPALVAGLVFGFGGYATGYPMEQLAVVASAAWIPGMLAGLVRVERAARGGRRRAALRWGIVAGIAGALMALGGHPQTAMYGAYLAAGWLAWRLVAGGGALLLRGALVAGLVGAGLSAVLWLPVAALLPHLAERFAPEEALAGLTLAELGQILAPSLGGRWWPLWVGPIGLLLVGWGVLRAPAARFWGGTALVAAIVALGGRTPILPALLTFAPGWDLFRHHERVAVIFALAAAVAAAYGARSVLYATRVARLEIRTATPMSTENRAMLRGLAIAKRLVWALLAVSIAGGVWLGFSGRSAAADDAAMAALAFGLAGVALVLAGRRALGAMSETVLIPGGLAHGSPGHSVPAATRGETRIEIEAEAHRTVRAAALSRSGDGVAAVLLVAAVALPLAATNRHAMIGVAASEDLSEIPLADFGEPGGAVLRAAIVEDGVLPGRVSTEGRVAPGANAAMLYGFYDTTGDSPFRLAGVADLVDSAPELVWWRLLNVERVVTARRFAPDAPLERLAPVALDQPQLGVADGSGASSGVGRRSEGMSVGSGTVEGEAVESTGSLAEPMVYQVLVDAPFAWVPTTVAPLPSPWRPEADFDPRTVALLPHPDSRAQSGQAMSDGESSEQDEASPMGHESAGAAPTYADGIVGTASLTGFGRFRIAIDAELETDGLVVLSSAFAPGWSVEAISNDGRRVKPTPQIAYGALLSVWLPRGDWHIRWTYLPRPTILGAALTMLTLLATAALWKLRLTSL